MPMFVLPFPVINPVLFQWGRWQFAGTRSPISPGWSPAGALIRRLVADDRSGAARRGRPPTASTICSSIARSASSSAVGSATCCSTIPSYYFAHPLEIFEVWRRRHGLPRRPDRRRARRLAVRAPLSACRLLTVFDLASLVAPIGIFLGRIANFIKPELWGRPTDVPWAMVFPGSDGLPRHPEPDLRGGARRPRGLRRAVDRRARWARCAVPACSPAVSAFSTALARIFCEFFRDPDPRLEDLGGGLTMGMLLSAPLIVIGARADRLESADETAAGGPT